MKQPINFYYYYYTGEPDRKLCDIQRVSSFLKDSTDFLNIFFDKQPKQELERLLQIDEYAEYNFVENFKVWIDEIKRRTLQELRNFTIATFTFKDKNECWDKLEIVGLTDVQLEIKLNIWDSIFKQLKILFDEAVIDFKNKSIPKFFELTKALYESLSTMFPTLEYLNEFLKYIETLFIN